MLTWFWEQALVSGLLVVLVFLNHRAHCSRNCICSASMACSFPADFPTRGVSNLRGFRFFDRAVNKQNTVITAKGIRDIVVARRGVCPLAVHQEPILILPRFQHQTHAPNVTPTILQLRCGWLPSIERTSYEHCFCIREIAINHHLLLV